MQVLLEGISDTDTEITIPLNMHEKKILKEKFNFGTRVNQTDVPFSRLHLSFTPLFRHGNASARQCSEEQEKLVQQL